MYPGHKYKHGPNTNVSLGNLTQARVVLLPVRERETNRDRAKERDRQTDGRMDGRTHGQTDRRTDIQKVGVGWGKWHNKQE